MTVVNNLQSVTELLQSRARTHPGELQLPPSLYPSSKAALSE